MGDGSKPVEQVMFFQLLTLDPFLLWHELDCCYLAEPKFDFDSANARCDLNKFTHDSFGTGWLAHSLK